MIKSTLMALIFVATLSIFSSCSKSDDFQACDSASLISKENNICLSFEHGKLTNAQIELIESKVRSGITAIGNLMPINDLRIRIVDNQNLVIPEIGMGGYNPSQHEVLLSIDADFPDLDMMLEEQFIPQLAHEIHHAKRRRSVGYGNTLLQAVVSEGLADHFSIEVSGIEPPPWSVALDDNNLQDWIEQAGSSWSQPYVHSDWFLGTSSDIPRWTGYSIGFELVKTFLSNNPNSSPSDLHDEPASSFEP